MPLRRQTTVHLPPLHSGTHNWQARDGIDRATSSHLLGIDAMRVVAGVFRSRRLQAPKGKHVRPTTDAVKESVFGILRSAVVEARVLDLFAGSGSLGIEAISRGAGHVTFVDRSSSSIGAVRDNLLALGIPKSLTRVVRADVRSALTGSGLPGPFDLIFLDPPYDTTLAHQTLQSIGVVDGLLHPDGTVIAEHHPNATVIDFYGELARVRVAKYGGSTVSFYGSPVPHDTESDD